MIKVLDVINGEYIEFPEKIIFNYSNATLQIENMPPVKWFGCHETPWSFLGIYTQQGFYSQQDFYKGYVRYLCIDKLADIILNNPQYEIQND